MLTMAVFAICITAPLGAIFINTLGPRWLDCELPNQDNKEVEMGDNEKTENNASAQVHPVEKCDERPGSATEKGGET